MSLVGMLYNVQLLRFAGEDGVASYSIMMYVTALGEVQYCAVDDVNANLQATPFWANAYTNVDPSGYKIISESKPMPMMPAESICWSVITTGPSIKAGA